MNTAQYDSGKRPSMYLWQLSSERDGKLDINSDPRNLGVPYDKERFRWIQGATILDSKLYISRSAGIGVRNHDVSLKTKDLWGLSEGDRSQTPVIAGDRIVFSLSKINPTASPMPTISCVDSKLLMQLSSSDGDIVPFKCSWIVKYSATFGGCSEVSALATHCPYSCETCEMYLAADSEATFQWGSKLRTCEWLSNKSTKCTVCSKKQKIRDTCRKTCQSCF